MWWLPGTQQLQQDKENPVMNQIKTQTISSIQISKIYSFQTAYWKKNIYSAEIVTVIRMVLVPVYIHGVVGCSAYRPQFLKYNYGNEKKNPKTIFLLFEIKT